MKPLACRWAVTGRTPAPDSAFTVLPQGRRRSFCTRLLPVVFSTLFGALVASVKVVSSAEQVCLLLPGNEGFFPALCFFAFLDLGFLASISPHFVLFLWVPL